MDIQYTIPFLVTMNEMLATVMNQFIFQLKLKRLLQHKIIHYLNFAAEIRVTSSPNILRLFKYLDSFPLILLRLVRCLLNAHL